MSASSISDSEYSSLSPKNSSTNGSFNSSSGVTMSSGFGFPPFMSIATLFLESAVRS